MRLAFTVFTSWKIRCILKKVEIVDKMNNSLISLGNTFSLQQSRVMFPMLYWFSAVLSSSSDCIGSGMSASGQLVCVGGFGDEAREERLRWLRHVQRTDGEFEWKDADGGTGAKATGYLLSLWDQGYCWSLDRRISRSKVILWNPMMTTHLLHTFYCLININVYNLCD